ncbi:hypothetical protein [Oscillatoria sp. FACHB-1407]|uniref:hypothetical protein n=1 Tax=Oscillatoria sp. FACHB-1407 TaxID=2692847 RepID=UPI001685061E|nr:hypothetical protein [Oscillatoria sp. FACHB-1407]
MNWKRDECLYGFGSAKPLRNSDLFAKLFKSGLDNEPQPHAVLLVEANAGGQTRISPDFASLH